MLHDEKILNKLASKIIEQHSFQFSSFPAAKSVITIPGTNPVEYIFDRLSLCIYSHNLDRESYCYLGKQLTKQFEIKYCREDLKRRYEYGVLFHFMSACPEYLSMKITKKDRPDFCLSENCSIGIEITELTTETDSVMQTIVKQNFGKRKSAAEVKQNAISRHGAKAKAYSYYDFGNTVAIDTGTFDVSVKKRVYVAEVIKKCTSYKNMISSYDQFIILCDAQHTICVNDKYDSDEIANIVRMEVSSIQGITLCILRDLDCKPIVDKYVI